MSEFDILDENLESLTPEQVSALTCYKDAVSFLMEDAWANLVSKKNSLVGMLEKHGAFTDIKELPESMQLAYQDLQNDALDIGVKYQQVIRTLSPTAFG